MKKKPKAKYSERDSRGYLVVACCECTRGGNGDKSCSCGGSVKRWNGGQCFSGNLLTKLQEA